MTKKSSQRPLVAAVSAALATSLFAINTANAEENPFQLNQLSSGYMVAESKVEGQMPPDDGVKREGSVGDDKLGSGQCGEGKCGTNAKSGEGELTGSAGDNKLGSGQCGEGKCGTDALKE